MAASVQKANEHLNGMAKEFVDELEGTLDVMYAEAARMQAAAREAVHSDEH